MQFWLLYLVVAACGTAIVHLGAPSLTAQAAQWARQYGAVTASQGGVTDAPLHVALPVVAAPDAASRPAVQARPSRPATSAPALPTANGAPDQESVAQAAVNDDGGSVDTTNEPAEVVEQQAAIEAAAPPRALYTPPAADPDAISWGIVLARAPYSGLGGNSLGQLPAGTVVEIKELKATAKGDMAVCAVDVNGQWKGPVLVGLQNLVRFDGPLTEAPPEALDLLYRYYRLLGVIEERQAELRRRAMPANPHEAEYNDAVAKLKAFDQKVDAMVKERDTASGPRRAKLIEELHAMKYEGNRLKYAFEQAEGKRKEWARQHPPPASLPRDAQLEAWQAELAQMEPEKRQYVD